MSDCEEDQTSQADLVTSKLLYGFRDTNFFDPHLLESVKAVKRRQSTIMCAIGKTDISHIELQTMMEAGMNVAKFKMWVFTKKDKIRLLKEVYKASKTLCEKYGVSDWPVATSVELKTCETKTGLLGSNQDKIHIKTGSEVILSHNIKIFDQCNSEQIFIDSPYLTQNVLPGNICCIGSDDILLKCIETVDKNSVRCKVIEGGKLESFSELSLKGQPYNDPFLSKKDYEILQFALDYHIDMVLINYCRSAECVRMVKHFLRDAPVKPAILCGICTQHGLRSIEDILIEADGIILPREYLTYEIEHRLQINMNKIQKYLGGLCQKAGKQLIISGGIFEEAVQNGTFYDTETFDVANSLLDGASGFILKNCNDIDYTVQTIKHLNEICGVHEPLTTNKMNFWQSIDYRKMPTNGAEAAVLSCMLLANQICAKAIIIPTVAGTTARYVLDMRPNCIVYTVCTSKKVSRKLATFRSVIPLVYTGRTKNLHWEEVISTRVQFALEYTVKKGHLAYGDKYVVLQRGSDNSSYCDTVRVWNMLLKKSSRVECPE